MAHDVFISHSSQDREVALAACEAIERGGHRCWIAPRDILPGQDYGEAIVDGIRAARVFVLIFSAHSSESPQVRRETERAANAGLAMVPVRIEEAQPSKSLEYFISSAHWLDAFPPPLDPHLAYLEAAVDRLLGGEATGRPLTMPPRPMPRPKRPRWVPVALAGMAGVAAIAAVGIYMARPAEKASPVARNNAVPDVSRTIFTRRAVPVRSDKPLRLRAGPSATARPVAVIGTDEVFRVAPRQGDWWPARLSDGREGYVAARWINVLDGEAR